MRTVLFCGAAVWALTAGLANAAAAESALEEVVITTDRSSFGADVVQAGGFRNARVLDTPLTVNVVPRAVLDAQQALGLYDALRNTGGVTRSQLNGATYDNIAIRGILVENRGNYRLNGSLPVINLVEQPLENKARVEVLKGASALYYGFVPPSGVINMTTKRPTRDPVTEVMLRADNHGSKSAAIDFTPGLAGVRRPGEPGGGPDRHGTAVRARRPQPGHRGARLDAERPRDRPLRRGIHPQGHLRAGRHRPAICRRRADRLAGDP